MDWSGAKNERQTEFRELLITERCDLGDATAVDPENVELEGPEFRVSRPAYKACGCRHPVGRRWQEAPLAHFRGVADQPWNRIPSLEDERIRWHRDPDILRNQRHCGVHITAFMGCDELLE